MATKLSAKSVGSIVKLKVNGVFKNFIVVHQGLPSSLYDSSCDGTWLLMEDIYEKRVWDSSDNDYANSDIHAYLNGTFLGMFDSDIQSAIKQVKLPYHKGTGSGGSVSSGANGLSTKIFLLSGYEVGWTTSTSSAFPVDGACLSYFSGTAATDSKRIGYFNGTAASWWLRSPYSGSTRGVWSVGTGGDYYGGSFYSFSYGVRPALVLDSSLSVSDDGTISGSNDGTISVSKPSINGQVTVDGAQKDLTGIGHANIGGVWKPIAKSYVNINGVWMPTWKESGTPISTLAVGTSVFMNVNATRREFIIVHQGLPSSVYDSSCNGTWLLMKDIYENRAWDSSDNDYENSDIHSYLNNAFVNLFDSDIKSAIKQIKLPYTKGTGSGGTLTTGSSGLSAKVFLLSHAEVGFSGGNTNAEGSVLSYFNGAANSERVAYLNGTAFQWWLRTPTIGSTLYAWGSDSNGARIFNRVTNSVGVRPALILPSELTVDENMNIIAA